MSFSEDAYGARSAAVASLRGTFSVTGEHAVGVRDDEAAQQRVHQLL